MIYSVICTDVNDYVDWQSELLEYSWKAAGQPGELLRLVTCPAETALPEQAHTRVLRVEPQPERMLGYLAFERLFAFEEWLRRERPEGTVLILDPDCVFRRAVTEGAEPGTPRAQSWVDYTPPAGSTQAATWPMLIHTSDLETLLPRWISFTAAIYTATRRWESDMYGLVSAAAAIGLRFSLEQVAAFVGWPDDAVGEAPIVHYCQDVRADDGARIWSKRNYRPWEPVADTGRPRERYCEDLLKILDDCAARKRG